MWVYVGVLSCSLLIALWDFPTLVKEKMRLESVFYILMLIFASIMNIAYFSNKDLGSPLNWLVALMHPIVSFFT